ncbi:MAG: DUF3883 domain-containing protein [Deltaproteobacteria bacterium]|nr:DUF3883 domain-containing protein [Deltaproteobacteria bacterium]
MSAEFELPISTFVRQYERFLQIVEEHPDSEGPFENFQSGHAHREEGYKEYVFHEARRRLASGTWQKFDIGTGKILRRVLEAVEINEGKDNRNNLVEWDSRRGEASRSHQKLYLAKEDPATLKTAEQLFYEFYCEGSSLAEAFGRFVQLLGKRYDIVSYFFFIRDWDQFMPARAETFEKAFDLLEIPLRLSHQCSWENYQSYLRRLRAVQACLAQVDAPVARLIDAHSFCWMLARAKGFEQERVGEATYIRIAPEAADFPPRERSSERPAEVVDFERLNLGRQRIGALAQLVVLEAEQRRLKEGGREDLAADVKDVSNRPALGYDIASFTADGEPKPIEVKAAATRKRGLKFFLSENELYWSTRLKNYTFALVTGLDSEGPCIHEFPAKELPPEALRPRNYEVRVCPSVE